MNVGALLPLLWNEIYPYLPYEHLYQYYPAIEPFLDLAAGRISSYGLAEGRGPILTANETRAIKKHIRKMAPGGKRTVGQKWKKNNRAITQPQRGYVRVAGNYGRYNMAANSKYVGEDKFHDVDLSSMGNVGVLETKINLCVIAQGAAGFHRIGRKIKILSVVIKIAVNKTTTDDPLFTSEVSKFSIVEDRQTNGATFAATDRLATDSLIRFNNLSNSSRFKTIQQKDVELQAQGATENVPGDWPQMFTTCVLSKKLNMVVEYGSVPDNLGGVATQRSNSLWFCQQALVGGLTNITSGKCRIRFRDV